MAHEIIREADHEEAIGAHSGFRIRVITRWAADRRQFTVEAYVRGSETQDEVSLDIQAGGFALLQDAQDHGFATATQWIDRQVI